MGKVEKRKTLVALSLFLLVFILYSLIALACDAKIQGWSLSSSEVQAGGTVTITSTIKFKSNFGEQCNFLIEGSVIPQDVPYSLLPLSTLISHSKCCPGNEIYDDSRFYMDLCLNPLGCEETKEVSLSLNAPSPTSFDHCADCSVEPERCKPGFYWRGTNYYLATLSTWNGCWVELHENLKKYDGRSSLIYVRSGIDGGAVCGNGNCEFGENFFTCPQDCSFWDFFNSQVDNLQITYFDLILIIMIIAVGALIIYKIYKGGKK